MSKQNFDKFINVKIKGAKKKEQIKQEKKSVKKEREAYFIEKKRELRAAKKLQNETQSPPDNYVAKTNQEPSSGKQDKRGKNAAKYAGKKGLDKRKENINPVIITEAPAESRKQFPKDKKSFKPDSTPINTKNTANTKPKRDIKPSKEKNEITGGDLKKAERLSIDKKLPKKAYDAGLPYERKPITKAVAIPDPSKKKSIEKPKAEPVAVVINKPARDNKPGHKKNEPVAAEIAQMPLNKYIAHGGVCSRRDAGELVKSGKVKVNGKVVTDPGFKVQEGDEIVANGKKVIPQHNLVYILLNKPKDFITTVDDPQGRKTVLDIVKSATNERIYPVGRLDRNTSGVLLLTNDGELAQHLTHPSFEVRKIYEAKLDKPLSKADFEKLLDGVELEDGKVHADSLAYADSKDKSIIGIEIHSGRNRVVRRMFEHLGYDVKGLDRVLFANLTKKNVERGKWRFLNDKEVRLLKFFNKSKQ